VRSDGAIQVTGKTGIVFVLLPGGFFTVGSQREDPAFRNYDALGVLSGNWIALPQKQLRQALQTTTPDNVLKEFGIDPADCPRGFRRGTGCQACRGKGKRGRIGIHEVMHVSPKLSSAISRGTHEDELQALADEAGYVRLLADGLDKATRGLVTLEDVLACARVE
jgi:hypothetical protein